MRKAREGTRDRKGPPQVLLRYDRAAGGHVGGRGEATLGHITYVTYLRNDTFDGKVPMLSGRRPEPDGNGFRKCIILFTP